MKNKILGFLFILLILAVIPLVNLNKASISKALPVFSDNNDHKTSLIAQKADATITDNYCDEAVKAVIIILNTNYKCDKNSFSTSDKKSYNSKTEKYVRELAGKHIVYKGKISPVPYFRYSKGYTATSAKYPYIKNSACPWDCGKNSDNIEGVSLNSLNELCKNGLNAEQALKHFLSDIEIKTTR